MSNLEDSNSVTPSRSNIPASVLREHPDAVCCNGQLPAWLIVLAGSALFVAGAYLGIFNGGFSGSVFDERESSPALLFPEKTGAGAASAGAEVAAADTESPIVRGKKFYSNPPANCASCHQPTGRGLPGSFPPLAGSEFVQGGSKRLAMILLKGLQGPVKVQGATFNGAMPTWEKVLTDKQIAYILTYVRQEWGNKAGEITPEQIAAARKEFTSRAEPWTEADLLAVPADAEMPGAPAPAPPSPAPEAKK